MKHKRISTKFKKDIQMTLTGRTTKELCNTINHLINDEALWNLYFTPRVEISEFSLLLVYREAH